MAMSSFQLGFYETEYIKGDYGYQLADDFDYDNPWNPTVKVDIVACILYVILMVIGEL